MTASHFRVGNRESKLKPNIFFSLLLFSVILVLRDCIWNALALSLVLPALDGTGSLSYPPRKVAYPRGFYSGDCLLFPCGK